MNNMKDTKTTTASFIEQKFFPKSKWKHSLEYRQGQT